PEARRSWPDLALWVALSACGSVMLLAATNQICLDIAVTPMLWVVPLALYLLTFVICFDNERWYSRPLFAALFVLALGLVGPTILFGPELGLAWQLAAHCFALFTACMLCHGELYRLRPAPRHLTLFYLAVAAGGCLGGLLVALVAPRVFTGYYEDSPIGLQLVELTRFSKCQKPRSNYVPKIYGKVSKKRPGSPYARLASLGHLLHLADCELERLAREFSDDEN
ncbi:MAG: hypothetical protein KC468_29350, partial [Myxococcales bacterium]|nr:hypothetical protein [Myxococcales bacterium]